MTAFPEGMRLASPGDERRIFDLFVMAHAENGWGDLDVKIVEDQIAKACAREGVVIALIDGPERMEAAIGMHPCKAAWYNSDAAANWHWADLLIYVHPLHRRSRHAAKLFQFALWWEQEIKMPVILGLLPRGQFEEKEKLFKRYGTRVGSAFLMSRFKSVVEADKARH